MLQDLREKAQGWFAWIILGAIGVTFVLFGTANLFQSGGFERAVVKVNGASISERELEEAYRRVMHSSGNEALKRMDPAQIKKEVLEGLIEERILLQNAKKLRLTISDEQINSVIRSLPVAKNAQGQFSQEAYLQFLSSANFTDHSFRDFIRDNMVLQQLQRGIAGTALALPLDVKDYAHYLYQQRDFQYTVLPESAVKDKAVVSDEALKEYYEAHANQFMSPEQIALQYVPISLKEVKNKTSDPEQAEEKFEILVDEIAQLAFDTPDSLQPIADKVEKPIEKTPLFSEGELQNSLLNRPEVMAVAFSANVKDDKNNSDIIKLDNENYVVIRLADYVPAKQKPFEAVKPEINQILVEQKIESLLKAQAEGMIESLKKDPKTEQNYTWNKEKGLDRMARGIDANLLETAFSMPRMLDPNKPELKATRLENEGYAIVWLTGVTDGKLELLSESQKKSIESELQTHWGRLEYALYVTDQINQAKVKRS